MTAPPVSAVIPAFNAERFIGEAIESVLAQTYSPIEVVVVDDGSTDSTAEVVERFPDVKCIRHENQGTPAARNAGIHASSGDLIAFLDADDLMTPQRTEHQVRLLGSNPSVAGVLGRQELLVEPGVELPDWVRESRIALAQREAGFEGSRYPDMITYPPMTLMAPRTAFESVGLFDPSFRFSDDVDWLFRAWETGLEIAVLEEVVMIRRIHGANLTYDTPRCRHAMFRLFKARIDRQRSRGAAPEAGLAAKGASG